MDCPICAESESLKVFETTNVQVLAHPSPAVEGHVLVVPKKHYPIFEAVPDDIIGELYNVANTVSVKLFEGMGAQGTNILLQNGLPAGQSEPHVVMHVVPRAQGDGIMFDWKPIQLTDEQLNNTQKLLQDALAAGLEQPKAEEVVEKKSEEAEEDWELKHLDRIP